MVEPDLMKLVKKLNYLAIILKNLFCFLQNQD